MTARHTPSFLPRIKLAAFWLAYLACVLVFLASIASYYERGLGFTRLILFGDKFAQQALPEIKATPHYVSQGYGYDGQWYAQLAARPNPWDPELQRALDNSWYRSGRILPSLLACGLSFGSTTLAVHLYAAQYIFVWLGIALLTLRWFPPGTLWNLCCWAGLLFSAGMMTAICRALPDAWAAALIIAAALLLERKSPWAPLLMSGAGLARETAVLAAAAFVDRIPRTVRALTRTAVPVAVALALPFLWHAALRVFGDSYALGPSAFMAPFAGLYQRVLEAFARASVADWDRLLFELSGPIALAVQAGFFALRWRVNDWRWRVGAANVPLLAILGHPIWEGTPSAASRVLVPMLFSFNLLLPRGAKWWPLLVLGNLSTLSGVALLLSPPPP